MLRLTLYEIVKEQKIVLLARSSSKNMEMSGLEPLTSCLSAFGGFVREAIRRSDGFASGEQSRRSIQKMDLSGLEPVASCKNMEMTGFEPVASCLQSRHSTS